MFVLGYISYLGTGSLISVEKYFKSSDLSIVMCQNHLTQRLSSYTVVIATIITTVITTVVIRGHKSQAWGHMND